MFTSMDLEQKISNLLAEREQKLAAEKEAHNRIIVIDRTVKSLKRVLKEAEEIINDKVEELETVAE